VVTTTPQPEGVALRAKWIAVNRAEQTVAAYEGERMVFATLASTGLPWWQTPDGLFRIWLKRRIGDMTGGRPDGEYFYLVEDVPWTMYFQGPYALHAAYWHDDFGYEHSRGCVNLSPNDARWLFEWASPSLPVGRQEIFLTEENPGTWVYVHHTPAEVGPAS
jgi:lipoprotein-anchoring transpeptidase ErfK/SrfK